MPQKYYAVKVGKKPGIYVDYHAFAQQMRGHKNAQGKAFKTETEARQYLGPAHWDDTVVTEKVKIAKLESVNLSLPQTP